MTLTLLVLAAGMGSRYGGLKQVDPVGPSGETMLDYAVFDALRAGFTRVVFVIRRDFEDQFRARVGAKYAGRIAVDYVFQSLDALPGGATPPAGREKPWGTGHAVWCAREALTGPFAVINADDFYGRDSLQQLATFLRQAATVSAGQAVPASMVGFRLINTLSENGAVSRGVCVVAADGALRSVTEHPGILPEQVGPGCVFSGDELVSMNCWGFLPGVFDGVDRLFRAFLAERGQELKSEFYLPAAISQLIADGQAAAQVLPTGSHWFGVTYRDDKPRVQSALAALVAAGDYPAKLFP